METTTSTINTAALRWLRGLGASVIQGAMLLGAFAPGRVTKGKLVQGAGSDKTQFKKISMVVTIKDWWTLLGGVTGPRPGGTT